MKATISLADPEETLITDIDARDWRAFEVTGRRDTGLPPALPMADVLKLYPQSAMAWVSWHALHRAGITADPFPTLDARYIRTVMDTPGDLLPDPTIAEAGAD